MFSIGDKNKITITQHDNAYLTFSVDNYNLTDGDIVHFIVKESYDNDESVIDITVTEFNDNKAIIFISENDTNIPVSLYVYGICVHTKEGFVCTVISGKFKIIGGVHSE